MFKLKITKGLSQQTQKKNNKNINNMSTMGKKALDLGVCTKINIIYIFDVVKRKGFFNEETLQHFFQEISLKI